MKESKERRKKGGRNLKQWMKGRDIDDIYENEKIKGMKDKEKDARLNKEKREEK